MLDMFVTFAVSHEPMSWLKAVALLNMSRIVVTSAVSQVRMSSLKVASFWNNACMSVIPDVQVVAAFEVVIWSFVRLVYSIPLTTPVSPTSASRQVTVTPFSASRKGPGGSGGVEVPGDVEVTGGLVADGRSGRGSILSSSSVSGSGCGVNRGVTRDGGGGVVVVGGTGVARSPVVGSGSVGG